MKSIKYSASFFTLFVFCLAAGAQRGTVKLDVNYSVAVPVGNFKNITNKTSFNGWEAAVMYGLSDQLSLGLKAGFQDFYQKYDREVFHTGGSDLSAVITNSVQLIPLLAKASYKLTAGGMIQPFVGLGVGANLAQYTKYYGQFTDSRSRFSFMAQPEVGLHMPVGKNKRISIHVAAAYNYVPFEYNDADGFNYASVKAGISVPLR